jgi:hypothetical protein
MGAAAVYSECAACGRAGTDGACGLRQCRAAARSAWARLRRRAGERPTHDRRPAPTSPAPPPVGPAFTPPAGQQITSATNYPPPERYTAPEPQPSVAQDQGGDSRNAVRALKAGPYFGAWFGIGAPFGGDTSSEPPAGFKQAPGGLVTAGWAFVPNFGIDAFFHYNSAQMVLTSRNENEFPQSSAYGLLYGLEARGIAGTGALVGWASAGISLGSGKLTGTSTGSSGVVIIDPNAPSSSTSSPIEGDLTLKPMPVLAFGAEVEVVRGLGLGPHVRWYITSVSSACKTQNESTVIGLDPITGAPVTREQTVTNCVENTSGLSVPDILFLGLGLTYRVGS